MHITVDEDLPTAVATMLRSAGYDAVSVVEQGMSGSTDAELWAVVRAESRFLVTADKGFADIRMHPPGTHVGVLLLRPDEDGIRPLVDLLGQVLTAGDLANLTGTVTVVTPRGIRVRRRAEQ